METTDATPPETEGQRIPLRVDEKDMHVGYANAFRLNSTAEELFLDFGLNMVNPSPGDPSQTEVVFQIRERLILNFLSAKRLALSLGQHVRRYEEQFGELELDATKRRQGTGRDGT